MTLTTNIAVTLLGYAATAVAAITWIALRKPPRIPLTRRTVLFLLFRTLLIFLLFFAVCEAFDLNALIVILIVVLSTIISSTLAWGPWGGPAAVAIGFIYLLQQWVLGFPDRHYLFLQAPDASAAPPDVAALERLIGRCARTTTALRPMGHILIDAAAYEASADTNFIPADADVRVVAVRNRRLVVAPAESDPRSVRPA